MKNIIKKTFLIIISTLLISNIPLYSQALSFDEILTAGDSFLEAGQGQTNSTQQILEGDGLQNLSNTVSNVLLTIALGVTLISAFIMAINFTVQSVEDKAKIKESMVPWIIGIIVSFGAYGIWRITMQVFQTIL